jgi:uroporphyrin-III C-methyltransferase
MIRQHLPILFNTKAKKALIIGGGKAALRKTIELVNTYNMDVSVVALDFIAGFDELSIYKVEGPYSSEELEDYDIVYCYTDDKVTNSQVLKDCKEKKILCTVSDFKEESDFKSPATWHHKALTFTVSSNDGDYRQSIQWRNRIQSLLTCAPIEGPKVFLVGFGPGDLGLMTIKTHQILDQADVILYDDLIDPQILALYDCEKVYVGKRKGLHCMKQEEINDLLIQKASNQNIVVRLKGGDPFIFGRGGEEVLALVKKGIPVEVVPGVTSALAAAAYTTTPLTHRGVSRSVAFQTAHHLDDSPVQVPSADTIVLYMGASKLKVLQKKLIDQNWSPETKVLLVQNASQTNQKQEIHKLADLTETSLGSPLCIIVGDVVNHFNPK